MANVTVGLDVGHFKVKAAVLRGSARKFSAEDFLSSELPVPATAAQVQDAIRALLLSLGEDSLDIIAAMPLERCSATLVNLPFSDKRRVAQTLPFEVEGNVPWDLDEVVLDWQVVDNEGPGAKLFVAMAKKDRVRGTIDQLVASGADPRLVGLDAAALAFLVPPLDEGVVLVDLGRDRTLICAVDGGRPYWVRSLDRGNGAFVDPESGATLPGFQTWLSEIRSSLLTAERAGFDTAELRLCGGGARATGLLPLLSEELGVPVVPLVLPTPSLRADEAPQPEPEHALAYALALRGLQPRGLYGVEFRQGPLARAADRRSAARLVFAGAALVVLLVLSLFGWNLWQLRGARRDLQTAQQQLVASVQGAFPEVAPSALGTPQSAIAVMQEKVTGVEQRVASLQGPSLTPLDVLKELSVTVPDSIVVDLDELSVTPETVRMRGRTDSFGSVDRIEAAMLANEKFQGAQKSDVNKNADGKMRFTITVPREKKEEEGG